MGGRRPAHTPPGAYRASGCAPAAQPGHSPTTHTARALGAHTAKRVPATPSTVQGWAPSTSQRCSWRPSTRRWRSSGDGTGEVSTTIGSSGFEADALVGTAADSAVPAEGFARVLDRKGVV